jgi:hypothetical protein
MKGAIHYPNGIHVVYSPTNCAWLVLWHGTVLRVCPKAEAIRYADELTRDEKAHHEAEASRCDLLEQLMADWRTDD